MYFGQTENKLNERISSKVDTSNIAIIDFGNKTNWVIKNSKPDTLSNEEIGAIDVLLKECIYYFNSTVQMEYDSVSHISPKSKINRSKFIIDLKKYNRQYLAFISEKGEKEV